jgi:hypothetical protein
MSTSISIYTFPCINAQLCYVYKMYNIDKHIATVIYESKATFEKQKAYKFS